MARFHKLRVGFVLDGLHLPAWARHVIQDLADCDFAIPVLVVLDRKEGVERNRPRAFDTLSGLVWDLYLRADRRFSRLGTPAFEIDDAAPLLRHLPVEAPPPAAGPNSEAGSSPAAESLRSYDLDVLVSLGAGVVRDDLLTEARYGLWTLQPRQAANSSAALGGFREAVEGRAVTCCELRMLNTSGSAVIAFSRLATHAWSISRNQDCYYWRGASLIVRKLRELQRLGAAVSLQVREVPARSDAIGPQSPQVSAWLPLLRQGGRIIRFLSRHFVFRDRWALLYSFSDQAPAGLEGYQLLRPTRGKFWADPFVVRDRDKYFVFIEEYVY